MRESAGAGMDLREELERAKPYLRRIWIILACLAMLYGLSLALFREDGLSPALAGLIFLSAFSLAVLAVLISALRRSVRETLYSYRNIYLTGGILFASILLAHLLSFFVTCIFNPGKLSVHNIVLTVLDFPEVFSYGAMFVMCAVSLLITVSNVSLVIHEGFRLKNLNGIIFGILFVGGTVGNYFLSDFLLSNVLVPLGISQNPVYLSLHTALFLFVVSMICYFECVFAGATLLGWQAVRTVPAYDKDFVFILGCMISREGGLLPLLKARTNRAIRFGWDQEIATGKAVRYIPSGGQGKDEVMSEGGAMELYLLSHGCEQVEVLPEKKSANTWENMCFSKKIIDREKQGAKVAYATTNFHVLRSGIYAVKAGLDAEGVSSRTKWYFWPNGFIREYFAILRDNLPTHVQTAAVFGTCCLALGFCLYLLRGAV